MWRLRRIAANVFGFHVLPSGYRRRRQGTAFLDIKSAPKNYASQKQNGI